MTTRTRTRSTVKANDPGHLVDQSIARHSLSLGPDQEHVGEMVPDCVGCAYRIAKGEAANISRQDHTARPLVYRTAKRRFVALDLNGPFVDIVDALLDAGLDCEDAEDEAWRLVQ